MPRLILYELESSYIVAADFGNYVKNEEELRKKLEPHKIVPLYMTTYYYPPRDSAEVRFAIGVDYNYFLKFLSKLHEAFGGGSKL